MFSKDTSQKKIKSNLFSQAKLYEIIYYPFPGRMCGSEEHNSFAGYKFMQMKNI